MTRPRGGVAQVMQRHGRAFVRDYPQSAHRLRVLGRIERCQTAAMGGRKIICTDDRAHVRVVYNSCRDRHCPRCGGGRRAQWVDAQESRLLPVPYFHVVFTLPGQLAPLALQNQRVVYGILMRAAADTLRELARDPKHLGADIGAVTVLHTWGQSLHHHPHVHCLVPGGGLQVDEKGARWRPCRNGFLLPVRVLRALYRGKVLGRLGDAYERGELELHGRLEPLRQRAAFYRLLRPLRRTKWVVHTKPPARRAAVVLRYLARYVGRIAIADRRVLRVDDDGVVFRWVDRRDGVHKLMRLSGGEFLRRFAQHVLPRGFVRIRHVGLLSNRRAADLRRCRELLTGRPAPPSPPESESSTEEPLRCEVCGAPVFTLRFEAHTRSGVEHPTAAWWDSS